MAKPPRKQGPTPKAPQNRKLPKEAQELCNEQHKIQQLTPEQQKIYDKQVGQGLAIMEALKGRSIQDAVYVLEAVRAILVLHTRQSPQMAMKTIEAVLSALEGQSPQEAANTVESVKAEITVVIQKFMDETALDYKDTRNAKCPKNKKRLN